jgi:hypothetical protein
MQLLNLLANAPLCDIIDKLHPVARFHAGRIHGGQQETRRRLDEE